MTDEMPAPTEAVFKRLKEAAAEMRTVTYGELAEAAGLRMAIGIGQHLNDIHARLRRRSHGLPWLVAIAVGQDGLPGSGLFANERGMQLDVENPNQRIWWRAMVLLVFATDWSAIDL